MSPYFPPERDRTYKCGGCGGTFTDTGFRCLVYHAPGTCCHYGDINAAGNGIGPDGKPFTKEAA